MNERNDATSVRSDRSRAPLIVYSIVEAVLLSAALVMPFPVGGLCNMLAMQLGLLALTVQIVRVRPSPTWAWRLIAGTGWTLVAGAIVAVLVYGLTISVIVHDPLSIVLAAIPLVSLGAGLGVLSMVAPRRGPADILDALMVALAAFLVLWTLWLGEAFAVNVVPAVIATILPLGLLVVLTMGVKLILGGGARQPTVAFVLLGAAALSAATIALLVRGVGRANLPMSPAINLLWALFGAALGVAALHPSLGYPRVRQRHPVNDTSVTRTVLFALLALLPLVIWASDTDRHQRADADAVPIATSALLLVLLVTRMGWVSRIAHQRAAQLQRRSGELAAAVSQQHELRRQLTFRATHDPLTNLSNRTVLADRMAGAIERGCPHALLLFDLDRFKDVNDTYGHPVGDELLLAVAERLRSGAPDDAVLARLGGDEFALFLEDPDEEAAVTATRLLDRLRPPYVIKGHQLVITASAGVLTAGRFSPPLSPDEALSDADLALYQAKEKGKDRVESFQADLRRARLEHARMTTGLRRALADDEFILHYQPVIELATGDIVAVEALLRWHQPGGALTFPDEFLPVAEDAGLIGQIGDWVLRQACRDGRRWHNDRGVAIFVNVAGRQLDNSDFATTVIKTIADAGMTSGAVVLELTEGSLLTDSPADIRIRQLRTLRDHDVRLAIDDFGTGYSSLSTVAQLPIDIVKIDRSLIQVLGNGPAPRRAWAFTSALVELLDSLDLVAVAEGVESAEQVRALRATKCPLAQGFHLGRPMRASDVDLLLGLA